MTKKNEALAKKIVDHAGIYEKIENTIVDPETSKEKSETVHKVVVDLGTIYSSVESTKKAAYESLYTIIGSDLDAEILVLSDTWVEDNIENVKDLTDLSEKQ